MNIHEKLQVVRVELAAEHLQKGGKNTYGNYGYFELADFLPQLNSLCHKYKLSHSTTVSDDMKQVVLTLRDWEKPEATIEFKIPMSTANLKASHPVQNLGAVLTYSRRYLYMLAFDITQNDTLEALSGKSGTVEKTPVQNEFVWDHSADVQDELSRLWTFVGWDVSTLPAYVEERAKKLNTPLDNTVYETVMRENFDYLVQEKQKGNAAYSNFVFSEDSGEVPF